MFRKIQDLHFHFCQLNAKVTRLMQHQSPCSHRIDQTHLLSGMKRHIGNTGRKGGRNVLDAKNLHAPSHTTVPCRHHNLPIKRRPRGRRPDDGKNRPVSPMGLVWTQGMRSMARKLSLHANMAKLLLSIQLLPSIQQHFVWHFKLPPNFLSLEDQPSVPSIQSYGILGLPYQSQWTRGILLDQLNDLA